MHVQKHEEIKQIINILKNESSNHSTVLEDLRNLLIRCFLLLLLNFYYIVQNFIDKEEDFGKICLEMGFFESFGKILTREDCDESVVV